MQVTVTKYATNRHALYTNYTPNTQICYYDDTMILIYIFYKFIMIVIKCDYVCTLFVYDDVVCDVTTIVLRFY